MERVGERPAFGTDSGRNWSWHCRVGSYDSEDLCQALFGGEKTLGELITIFRIAAARISAQTQANQAVREQAALETRQVWLDSLLTDRWKVQEIMDHQARALEWQTELPKHFEALRRDRAKAQLVMDAQHEQLEHWGPNPIGSRRRSSN